MEALFEKPYKNTRPLRKFEPLVRFDVDGNPQPRRPIIDAEGNLKLDEKPVPDAKVKKESLPETKSTNGSSNKTNGDKIESNSTTTTLQTTTSTTNGDLKRKVEQTPSGVEPKKKQQKQTSIMSFFKKG